ncbi:hypothetical protein GJR99_11840 [Haloferax sp. MBLA0078]|uniref:Uncharacterized protein n=1 Tax=Haloferax marinum TaxID=2666143 RepID=A0A6A8G7Y7_9EURY|nr:hypothetical protein Hfx1150_11885 [Haloferax sp. CBA1150]MRW97259.1 hypothetical protein [Haloferax marinum]
MLSTAALDTNPQSGPDARNGLKLAARFGHNGARCWMVSHCRAHAFRAPMARVKARKACAESVGCSRCERAAAGESWCRKKTLSRRLWNNNEY